MSKPRKQPKHGKAFTAKQYDQIDEQVRDILALLVGDTGDHDLREIVIVVGNARIQLDPGETMVELFIALKRFYWSIGREKALASLLQSLNVCDDLKLKINSTHVHKRFLDARRESIKVNDAGSNGKPKTTFRRTMITIQSRETRTTDSSICYDYDTDRRYSTSNESDKEETEYYYLVNDELREAVDNHKGKVTRSAALDLIRKHGRLDCIAEVMAYASQSKADRKLACQMVDEHGFTATVIL